MKRVILVALAFVITACKTVTVTNPVSSKVYTTPPEIVLTFPKGKPDKISVFLNNTDVTSSLTSITDTGATIPVDVVRPALQENENFVVVQTPITPRVKFFYDTTGPMVHITSVNIGTNIQIRGYVEDVSGTKSVSMDGVAVQLDSNNNFSVTTSVKPFYTFSTEDNNGFKRTQKFADQSNIAKNSVSVRINKNGLNFVVGQTAKVLASPALGQMITRFNPIKQGNILLDSYRIDANDAKIGRAELALSGTATSGTFNVSGTFYDVWANGTFSYDFWAPLLPTLSKSGNIMLDSASFTGTAAVSIVNGSVKVTIPSLKLSLNTLRTDISGFPDGFASIFYDAFNWVFELILADQIKQILPPKLAEFVDTFPKELYVDINGSKLKPDIVPESLTSSVSTIDLSLSSRVYALTNNGPKLLGSDWIDVPAVPVASNISPNGKVMDVGAMLSQDMVNQILSAATSSGLLSLNLTEKDILGVATGSTSSAKLITRPSQAPVIEFVKSSKGLAKFRMHDFYIRLDGIVDSTMTYKTLIGATTDIEAFVNIGVDDSGMLGLEFVGLPQIRVKNIEQGTLVLSTELAQMFIDETTRLALPFIQKVTGRIPLPSFEGLKINIGEMWVPQSGVVGTNITIVDSAQVTSAAPSTMMTANPTYDKNLPVVIMLSSTATLAQYKYKLDNNPWSFWMSRGSVDLYGLKVGDHTITVCSRTMTLVEDKVCTTGSFAVK